MLASVLAVLLSVVAVAGAAGAAASGAPAAETPATDLLVIVGAPGAEEFKEGFARAAAALEAAGKRSGARVAVVGLGDQDPAAPADRDRIRAWLEDLDPATPAPAWLVFVGHGTWDGRDARLNLRGPDLTARDLASWLEPIRRTTIIVHGGSASGPFVSRLSAPGRIVVAATESGDEVNYARFGEKFAAAIGSPAADIDQDGRVSLLEAFVRAAQDVRLFYDEAGRMATEHAMIDDNGDGRGTPAEWFRGTRVERRSETGEAPDGSFAHRIALVETPAERRLTAAQRSLRDALELELEDLRSRKGSLDPEAYFRELETLLRQLSPLYLEPDAAADRDDS